MEKGEVAEDDGTALGGDVEVAHVGGSAKAGGEIHFEVPLKVENNRYDHDKFVNPLHGFRMLHDDGFLGEKTAA